MILQGIYNVSVQCDSEEQYICYDVLQSTRFFLFLKHVLDLL